MVKLRYPIEWLTEKDRTVQSQVSNLSKIVIMNDTVMIDTSLFGHLRLGT